MHITSTNCHRSVVRVHRVNLPVRLNWRTRTLWRVARGSGEDPWVSGGLGMGRTLAPWGWTGALEWACCAGCRPSRARTHGSGEPGSACSRSWSTGRSCSHGGAPLSLLLANSPAGTSRSPGTAPGPVKGWTACTIPEKSRHQAALRSGTTGKKYAPEKINTYENKACHKI